MGCAYRVPPAGCARAHPALRVPANQGAYSCSQNSGDKGVWG